MMKKSDTVQTIPRIRIYIEMTVKVTVNDRVILVLHLAYYA